MNALYHAAANNEFLEIATLLERRLVHINQKNEQGETPLLVAVATNSVQSEMMLLHYGADHQTPDQVLSLTSHGAV